MADMMETLKELLGDNADEKLSSVLNMLSSGNENGSSERNAKSDTQAPAITPELLMQAQSIMQQLSSAENDDRSNLLISLKPYMRESRKKTIDDAVKFLSAARLTKLFQGGS